MVVNKKSTNLVPIIYGNLRYIALDFKYREVFQKKDELFNEFSSRCMHLSNLGNFHVYENKGTLDN